MKNSSLHILKAIFSFLLGWLLVLSCTKDDVNQDIPAGVPNPNASEIVVKLLIKGEAILPPSTRAMDESTEGTFQDSLQLFILEKQGDKYVYNCHRPVNKGEAEGSFIVRVPRVLEGKDLKFLLFANSKNVIGENPDEKFLNQDEDSIRKSLIQNMDRKWEQWAIPMWAEDTLTPFNSPTGGAQSTAVANLKLVRMLARVDVGLGYPKEPNSKSTAAGLPNFKLQTVKVYHSKNRGQLMPDAGAYETTVAGADKIITIKRPSIPEGVSDIAPYTIPVSDGANACEREIYMFEQLIKDANGTGFKKERTCLLIKGEYTDAGGTKYAGWYRLDFRGFGDDTDYTDVLRNKLYRFNIIEVKGSGYASEEDALNSQASNITVNLQAMELEQNDIIFDGQSFLSVSASELFFYQDRNTASFTLSTDHVKGWEIKTDGVNGITAVPASGDAGTSKVTLTWSPLPGAEEGQTIKLIAGNLEKTLSLKYKAEDAPGNLTSFSLNPPFLYFQKSGGTGRVDILTNITKKYLSSTLGNLDFTVPAEVTGDEFNVVVNAFSKTSSKAVEQGTLEVSVKASNADITAPCTINQLTYDKVLTVTSVPVLGHGAGPTSASTDVTYATTEAEGTYRIEFYPDGSDSPKQTWTSAPVNGTGTFKFDAKLNETAAERVLGKFRFEPAIGGEKIPLIGYNVQEVTVKQAAVPLPTLSFTIPQDIPWSGGEHEFSVNLDSVYFSPYKNLTLTPKGENRDDITILDKETLKWDAPVRFTLKANRGDAAKKIDFTAGVWGYGSRVAQKDSAITQQPAQPIGRKPVAESPTGELPWDVTQATLKVTDLDNVYEVKAGEQVDVDGFSPLQVTWGDFTMNADKTSAEATATFTQNTDPNKRKVSLTASVIGNRESSKKSVAFTIEQGTQPLGTIAFTNSTLSVPGDSKDENMQLRTFEAPGRMERMNHSTLRVVELDPKETWISVGGPPTNSTDGNFGLAFQLAPNSSTSVRTARFKLVGNDNVGREITSDILSVTQSVAPTGFIRFVTTEQAFPREESTLTYDLAANHVDFTSPVTLNSKPDWIKEARIQMSGGIYKLFVTAAKNATGSVHSRTGTISVSAKDRAGRTITTPKAATAKKKGNLTQGENVSVTYEATATGKQELTIPIDRNYRELNFNNSKEPSWTQTSGSGNIVTEVIYINSGIARQAKFNVRVNPYNGADPRESVLTIKWPNYDHPSDTDEGTSYVYIKQNGTDVFFNDYESQFVWIPAPLKGQSVTRKGRIYTKGLQPGSYIRARIKAESTSGGAEIRHTENFAANSTDALGKEFEITLDFTNGQSPKFIGALEIIGTGVNGDTKILRTIDCR